MRLVIVTFPGQFHLLLYTVFNIMSPAIVINITSTLNFSIVSEFILAMSNPVLSVSLNSVDPDQLASDEAI